MRGAPISSCFIGAGWGARARSTSRCARSACAEPRHCALEVLLRTAAAHADRAEDAIATLDENRSQSWHDRKAHQSVGDAEEGGPVLGELRKTCTVPAEHHRP